MVDLQLQGVLFDLDGVLVSSLGFLERSWQRYAEFRGVDPEVAVKLAHGRRAIETVHTLRPDLDSETELRVIEEMEMEDNEGLVVLPGVREMLRALAEGPWAIVTSATERLARSRLAFAGIDLPKHLITGDRVTRGKPHPEPYQQGAALLGAPPHTCVVIEDAPAGVAAGKAAGCQVMAVLTTHAPEALMAADWRVATLIDVQAILDPCESLRLRFNP